MARLTYFFFIPSAALSYSANQTSGPKYKFLISEVGGEKRFAAAVAKRLALLGALTQGDRRATGQSNALGLTSFDMDNKFGTKALRAMLDDVWQCTSSSFDSETTNKMIVQGLETIDKHLIDILKEGDNWQMNLAPYSDDSQTEQTYYTMMKDLLLGPCMNLAASRVAAIKDDRSIVNYMTQICEAPEEKDAIKAKMDVEVDAAKERGLNFHALCYIWLYEVGITQQSESKSIRPINVPKFLNRMLGMNLDRQKLMTDVSIVYCEKLSKSLPRQLINYLHIIFQIASLHKAFSQAPREGSGQCEESRNV